MINGMQWFLCKEGLNWLGLFILKKRELILEHYKIVSGMEKMNKEEMFTVSSKKRTSGNKWNQQDLA